MRHKPDNSHAATDSFFYFTIYLVGMFALCAAAIAVVTSLSDTQEVVSPEVQEFIENDSPSSGVHLH